MAKVFRWFLGSCNGRVDCHFDHPVVHNQSVVLVSVSEGVGGGREGAFSTAAPARFLGNAPMRVENISPRRDDSGVDFRIVVDWFEPLGVWVDIFVADEVPRGVFRSK
jgi:hypothetical protein